MEHQTAVATRASERYLLNEMSEPERFDFEAHYFECESCAEDVRSGEVMSRCIRAVGGELPDEAENPSRAKTGGWRDWFRVPVLVPATAALAMTLMAGFQGLVTIPELRATAEPQEVQPVVLRAVARGEDAVVTVNREHVLSALVLDVNQGKAGEALQWKLQPPAGDAAIEGSASVPPSGTQLQLAVPSATLRRAGDWTLFLRSSQGQEVGRYPFRVEIK